MLVNIIRSSRQHYIALNPVKDALLRRGHDIVETYWESAPRADCSLLEGMYCNKDAVRPRFMIWHGGGLIKGYAWWKLDIEYFLVPSEYWKEHIDRCRGKKTYKVIADLGYPKIDAYLELNRERKQIKERIINKQILDSRPIVVYFPTVKTRRKDRARNYRDCSFREIRRELSKDYNFGIFPHTCEKYDDWDELTQSRELERIEYLVASDLLVSDRSGIAFEYCVFDKPIVLLDKEGFPDYFKVFGKHRGCFDAGERVLLPDLKDAIKMALEDPKLNSKRRSYWADLAFGPWRDSRSSERVVDAIENGVKEHAN